MSLQIQDVTHSNDYADCIGQRCIKSMQARVISDTVGAIWYRKWRRTAISYVLTSFNLYPVKVAQFLVSRQVS